MSDMLNDGDKLYRPFREDDYYYLQVDKNGEVTVYSECCACTMSDETARELYKVLHEFYGKGDE